MLLIPNSMRIPRIHRISVDLDSKGQLAVLKAYYNAKNYGSTVLYESDKGYHIQIVAMNRTTEQNINVRRALNDCRDRIELDENRIVNGDEDLIETLFRKKKHYRRITGETEMELLSLPFWSFPR